MKDKKYGAYIKKRGWIKEVKWGREFKCCRSVGDVNKEFIFKNKWALNKVVKKYSNLFEDVEFEYREISEDQLMDKRVVPSKKKYNYRDNVFIPRPYEARKYGETYCEWCNLYMPKEEAVVDGICIHCVKEFCDTLSEVYEGIDDEIKASWQRAKILDEI